MMTTINSYLNIVDSAASPIDVWYAENSTNGGNNTGWNITSGNYIFCNYLEIQDSGASPSFVWYANLSVDVSNNTGWIFTEIPPEPIVVIDTHDGGKKRKKQYEQEAAKAKKRRDEVVALFEHLVEGKPLIAEEIAAPYIKEATISELKSIDFINTIDFDALMADLARVQQIYDAYIEMDDEEVLALL